MAILQAPPGLARWDKHLGGTDSAEGIAEMLAQPRLAESMRASVKKALAFCDSDPAAHANIRDMGRLILASIALYLDATGGLTHTRMRELSGEAGTLSAGRATAILLHMRMIGYVTAHATRADGSARLYVPTEKMKDVMRRRLLIELESLALFEPEMHALIARLGEDEPFRIFIAHLGALIGQGAPRPELKTYDAITHKNSGTIMLFALYQAADRGGPTFPEPGFARVSVSALARRFRASRAHVLRVLREAEDAGFLKRAEDGVEILPLLCDTFRLYYAISHLVLGGVAYRTLTTLKTQETAKAAQ